MPDNKISHRVFIFKHALFFSFFFVFRNDVESRENITPGIPEGTSTALRYRLPQLEKLGYLFRLAAHLESFCTFRPSPRRSRYARARPSAIRTYGVDQG